MNHSVLARFAAAAVLAAAPLAVSAQPAPAPAPQAPLTAPATGIRTLPDGPRIVRGRWARGHVEREVQHRFYGGLRTLGLSAEQREQIRAISRSASGDAHDQRVAILNTLTADQRDQLERELRHPHHRGRRPLT